MLRRCKAIPTRKIFAGWQKQANSSSFGTSRTPWTERVKHERIQIYASTSNDPYLNLAIEQFLLQNSPPESTVLFTYVNRPCVVIGRNQNPWLEVNLNLLGRPLAQEGLNGSNNDQHAFIDLIRRRSGGGTVFHDEGNVNWSVICPPSVFTRDKHCEMVVRALRTCGIERSRVNERHDIVLDQGHDSKPVPRDDMHRTPYTSTNSDELRPLKVSGSAYKLTRTRALHHATMLLASPNLSVIPWVLRSPAKGFIVAKGVDSVSSLVGNIGLERTAFLEALSQQFASLYNDDEQRDTEPVGQELAHDANIAALVAEMKTDDWLYGQTPHFTFDTHRPVEQDGTIAADGCDLPPAARIFIDSRHGKIQKTKISISSTPNLAEKETPTIAQKLDGSCLYKIGRWGMVLNDLPLGAGTAEIERVISFLDKTLPASAPH